MFAAERADRLEVRRRIDAALGDGELTGPGGAVTRWELVNSGADQVVEADLGYGFAG